MTGSDVLQRGEREIGGALHKKSEDQESTCPPGSAGQWELSMPQRSVAPHGQDPLLASAGSSRQQARSRNQTPPPPAARRSTLPDVPASQERPAVQASQPQSSPTRCTTLRRLFAALLLVVLLFGLPAPLLELSTPGFASSAKDAVVKYGTESPAVQKITAFASSAKVALMERVTESPTMQRLAELTTSAKQALFELMIKSPSLQKAYESIHSAMQELAELATSLRKALVELVTNSPALQKAMELMIEAKESVLNFSTECMLRLRSWGQSMYPAEHPTSPQAAVDAECTGPECESEWQAAQPVRSTEKPVQGVADAECTGSECQAETQTAQPLPSMEKPTVLQAGPDAGCRRRGAQCAGLQEDNGTPSP
eukprot:TRINITY_DN75604_c0_g1_i1.p1 TRINITY_DN75604_c0_g1~~TRINITY_DN75604_c0_g1_i1.p1  ORF type:complete len:369 (+),score=67.49 TRINITY_DN75604_c0_g1_i1:128-1234(+)